MPKQKTNRGAHKRFKVTKNKKFKYAKSKRRHLLESKSSKQSRVMRQAATVQKADWKRVHALLPYA